MALPLEVPVAPKIETIAMSDASTSTHAAQTTNPPVRDRNNLAILVLIGASTLLVHMLAAGRYGFNRDELSFLEDARHLAWGYVAYPPLTPFFGRIALALFGTSLVGFRFFSALIQAVSVVLTGCMAKDMGGGRAAQVVAACASIPFSLGVGALMQYMSFDYFAWVLTAFFLVRLLTTSNPRYFLLVGASIGVGMLAKYTMLFFAIGVLAGLLLSDARKYFRTIWPWLGLLVSLVIVAPNFLWQVRHYFVSYQFLRFIHQRDVSERLDADLPARSVGNDPLVVSALARRTLLLSPHARRSDLPRTGRSLSGNVGSVRPRKRPRVLSGAGVPDVVCGGWSVA